MQASGSGAMGPTQGFISVTLSSRMERERTIWQIEDAVRAAMTSIPNVANVVIKEVGSTAKPTTLAPVVARVSGPDPLVLDRLGGHIVAALSHVDDLVEPTRVWRRDMRRALVRVDAQRAASIGQTPLSIARFLASGAEGIKSGDWTPDFAPAEPIIVRFKRGRDPEMKDVLSWPLFVPQTGDVVPVRTVADAYTTIEQGLYTTENQVPVLDVLAQVDGRPLNFVVADAKAALSDVVVPQGYTVSIIGENSDLVEARASILSALGVSILAVYLLLVAQFKSWMHPVTVMMAVPLSISGVALALFLASKPVSMPVDGGVGALGGHGGQQLDFTRGSHRTTAGEWRRSTHRHPLCGQGTLQADHDDLIVDGDRHVAAGLGACIGCGAVLALGHRRDRRHVGLDAAHAHRDSSVVRRRRQRSHATLWTICCSKGRGGRAGAGCHGARFRRGPEGRRDPGPRRDPDQLQP